VSATKSTTGTPRRKGDRLIKFETGVVAGATEIGGFIPGETGLRLTQIISPKNVRRRRRCPAYLLKTRDYFCLLIPTQRAHPVTSVPPGSFSSQLSRAREARPVLPLVDR
jgi:hypothetical protein